MIQASSETARTSLTGTGDDRAFFEEAAQLRLNAIATGLAEGNFKIEGPLAQHPPIRKCAERALVMIETAMQVAQSGGDRMRMGKLQKNRADVEAILEVKP